MPKVLIMVEPAAVDPRSGALSATVARGVAALKQAILTTGASGRLPPPATDVAVAGVEVMVASDLTPEQFSLSNPVGHDWICPLTLDLPEWLAFPAKSVYQACRNVLELRQRVAAWQYSIGSGSFWLPIVLTANGPLYAEVIGADPDKLSSYTQPIHLSDTYRQLLYALAYRLLCSLNALPGVYLLQFGFRQQHFCFDRLLPFPGAAAIASLEVQTPDLFMCHWRCLIGEPIYDLSIRVPDQYLPGFQTVLPA